MKHGLDESFGESKQQDVRESFHLVLMWQFDLMGGYQQKEQGTVHAS